MQLASLTHTHMSTCLVNKCTSSQTGGGSFCIRRLALKRYGDVDSPADADIYDVEDASRSNQTWLSHRSHTPSLRGSPQNTNPNKEAVTKTSLDGELVIHPRSETIGLVG